MPSREERQLKADGGGCCGIEQNDDTAGERERGKRVAPPKRQPRGNADEQHDGGADDRGCAARQKTIKNQECSDHGIAELQRMPPPDKQQRARQNGDVQPGNGEQVSDADRV